MNLETQIKNHLIEVRELISDPKHWTRGSFAKTDSGAVIGPIQPAASCWCLAGAVRKITDDNLELANDIFYELERVLRDIGVDHHLTIFNDDHTHSQVLAVVDKAIEGLDTSNATE